MRGGITVTNDNYGSQPMPPQGWPGQYPPPNHGWSGQYPPPNYPPYGASPVPPAPPAKRRWPWIVGAIVAVIVLIVGGVSATVAVVGGQAERETTVIYEITGPPGSVDVEYWIEPGGAAMLEDVPLPWRTEVILKGDNPYASLSASRSEASNVALQCRISVEGETVFEEQSISRFVTCGDNIDLQ